MRPAAGSLRLPATGGRWLSQAKMGAMTEHYRVRPEATESAFGTIVTDGARYRPLDTATVRISGRAGGDTHCTVRVCDPEQGPYVESEVALAANHGSFSFLTHGRLGTHYVYLVWPGDGAHSRYTTFNLDCETCIESGDADLDELYSLTRDAMLRGRREYETASGRLVGYVSADTVHFDGIWLRDWMYGLPAYRFWERDMACGLDRFLEQQRDDGMVLDGIGRDGHTWRVGLESDVEYILVMGVWQTWQVTGDDSWLATALPKLERALGYIRRDDKHWDEAHSLVKRQHSCDTWDFDIDSASDAGDSRHVIATCDQSGYGLAFEAMSRMYRHAGNDAEAERWHAEAEAYRRRANELLWDGTKYQHHIHLDQIDHGDFDETQQLAMGNTWAMTRGLATPEQARSIVDEFRRRHAETGDAYPWWSLQPGYPDHLEYFGESFRKQGGYANGGLMPWVGGELCRAAFWFGREAYGVELLRQYIALIKERGGAQVWYWPNGEPGFRTTNEVPNASWGMAEWLNALVEGLAGVRDGSAQLRRVSLAPRWAAAGLHRTRVTVRYAASKAYCAYSMQIDEDPPTIRLLCTGSGELMEARVLLPDSWSVEAVALGDTLLPHRHESADTSHYACFTVPIPCVDPVVIRCRAG